LSLPQPDHGVLRKAQRGDERAFAIIVRAYQIPVYNYVLRMVGDRSLAEDLTQEVFLRVFQGLPRFSLRSKFTTWLFQVTKNRVLDELRATERRPRAVVDLDDIPPLESVDAPFERLEAIDAVWRAVERLSVDLKMALLLRDVVGLSYGEIADSLEVTLATVKWRIWKAREDVQLRSSRRRPSRRRRPCPCSHRPRRKALPPEREPRGEHLRQADLPYLLLRSRDVVVDTPEARML
jgi:RNA polymerase sigma-70 factor, ECF subfamily